MNLESLQAVLGPANVSASLEHRRVYSRDASRLSGDCRAVAFPAHPEHVVALVEWARHERVDVVPRGAGTGLCGGATPQHSVVADLSRLSAIHVDVERQRAQVGAGVVLETLNRRLAPYHLFLPVVPGSHRAASIGGMIATNAAGLHAIRYGMMRAWVDEVTLVDGLGNVEQLNGDTLDDVAGREGATGFIVAATVRLAARPASRTLSFLAFDDEASLLVQRDRWLKNEQLTALEYLNRHAAQAIGWDARPHLFAEFEGNGGDITDPTRIAALWRARDHLYPTLARDDRPVIEDPRVEGEALGDLLTWLDAERIPAFGHLGLGIVHPCFRIHDDRVEALYERVAAAGGRVSGEHGIGLKKKTWVDAAWRTEMRALKEIYDPDHLINRGKAC